MKILSVLCLCLMLGLTGCGSNDSRDDYMNDATENTQDHLMEGNGGVIDDIGDAVGEGINGIGDGVEDFTEQQNNR